MKLKKIDDEDGFETYYSSEENRGVFITHTTHEKRPKGLMRLFKKPEKILETSVVFSEGEVYKDIYNCGGKEYPIIMGIEKEYRNGNIVRLVDGVKIGILENDFEVLNSSGEKINNDLMGRDMELTEKYEPVLKQLPEEIKKNIHIE